jgi:hypothetical protein
VPSPVDRSTATNVVQEGLRRLRSRLNWFHYDFVPRDLVRLPEEFETFFPTMEKGRSFNAWVPHTGRWDRRFPGVGWCTLEEATILHNYGLRAGGGEALEVGSWVGWSTLALGLAGVRVTVIDPLLEGSPQAETLASALARSGLADVVEGVAGRSPEAVEALTGVGRRWSLFFVDGEHLGEAPLLDAKACSAAARDAAVIVLHDAVQKNVCDALAWLAEHGWCCGIHRTAQLLAVAWKGTARPIHHEPDPLVPWDWLFRRQWPHCTRFPLV